MKFNVLTLFPEIINTVFKESITGRAVKNSLIELNTVNIRDFSKDKHKKVDDYIYGGGAGMLMQAQPVYDAYLSLNAKSDTKVIYVTPVGKTFNQEIACELSKEDELIFICGHYEGIDERVIKKIVTDRISIGDYVLTGGELPSLVIMDAIARMIPGVLGNDISFKDESFFSGLLEYPQYSRPEVWEEMDVPKVLLSGDHKKVDEWRLERALEITGELRPDMYEAWSLKNEEYFIKKAKKEEKERKKLAKKLKL